MNGKRKNDFWRPFYLLYMDLILLLFPKVEKGHIPQYLRSFVNKGALDKNAQLNCSLKLTRNNTRSLRSWDSLRNKTEEEIIVKKDGFYNDFLTKIGQCL